MGDVSCMFCDKVLPQKKFAFKCKRCHDEFDDVAGLMAHFKDPVALDALSCEGVSQEDLVRVKQEVAKIEQSFEGVHTQTIYDHEEGPSTAATATTGDEEFKRRLQPKITIKIEGTNWKGPHDDEDDFDMSYDYDGESYLGWTDDDSMGYKDRTGKAAPKPPAQVLTPAADRIQCDLCGLYLKKSAMRTHLSRKHGKGRVVECDLCDYKTHYTNHMSRHKAQKHGIRDGSFVKMCLVCGYDHVDIRRLKTHIKKHHGDDALDEFEHYDWSNHNPDTHQFAEPNPQLDRIYQCKTCGEEFKSNAALSSHLAEHNSEECEFCMERVPTKKMSKHLSDMHGISPHCTACNKHFESNVALQNHMRKLHFVKSNEENGKAMEVYNTFKCFTCCMVFENVEEFESHNQTRESCPYCHDGLTHEKYHEHMVSIHKADLDMGYGLIDVTLNGAYVEYKCSNCDKKFNRMKPLKKHFWITHDMQAVFKVHEGTTFQKEKFVREQTDVEYVICDMCGLNIRKTWIKQHKNRKHGMGKVHQCELCGLKTSYKNTLTTHMKEKHGIGDDAMLKFCLLCGYESVTTHVVKLHILRRHGEAEWERWKAYDWANHDPTTHVFVMPKPEKPKRHPKLPVYKCDLCEDAKVFKNNRYLQKHMAVFHMQKTDHNCPLCEFTTKHKSHLRRHLKKKHPMAQPYSELCHLCQESFPTKKGVANHIKKVHRPMPDQPQPVLP